MSKQAKIQERPAKIQERLRDVPARLRSDYKNDIWYSTYVPELTKEAATYIDALEARLVPNIPVLVDTVNRIDTLESQLAAVRELCDEMDAATERDEDGMCFAVSTHDIRRIIDGGEKHD